MPRRTSNSAPSTNVQATAQQLVDARLTRVHESLRKAAQASPRKGAPVHKLRVATRRARAALELFEPVLPRRKSAWFLKKLRTIRKAADEARNLDVYQARLARQQVAVPDAVADLLRERREAAQAPLQKLDQQLRVSGAWRRRQRTWRKKLRDGRRGKSWSRISLRDFAPQALSPSIAEFAAALAARDRSAEHLHRLRVAGKQVRYALELLEGALPNKVRASLLAQLAELQEVLGGLNDCVTADELLEQLAASAATPAVRRWFKARQKEERSAFAAGRARFLRGWTVKERQKWHAWLARCSANGSAAAPSP